MKILLLAIAVGAAAAQQVGFKPPKEADEALAKLAERVSTPELQQKFETRFGRDWNTSVGLLKSGLLASADRPRVQRTIDGSLKPVGLLPGTIQVVLPQNPAVVPVLTGGQQDILLAKARSVGRLLWKYCPAEIPECFAPKATLFMIGQQIAATNCHAILPYIRKTQGGWELSPTQELRADFGYTRKIETKETFRVSALVGCSPLEGFDVALLRLDPASKGGVATLPPALEIERNALERDWAALGSRIYTIGYPQWSNASQEDILALRSGGSFGKIASPGIVTGTIPQGGYRVLQHSSTTDGGNSGSPIIDMLTYRVVGVHSCCKNTSTQSVAVEPSCARVFGDAGYNLALPTWFLLQDPVLKSHLPPL